MIEQKYTRRSRFIFNKGLMSLVGLSFAVLNNINTPLVYTFQLLFLKQRRQDENMTNVTHLGVLKR
jgi:hypothetical protein